MTTNQTKMTKVYAVIGGWSYENEDFKTLRLFDCQSTADAYRKELESKTYDYVLMETKEINHDSTFSMDAGVSLVK